MIHVELDPDDADVLRKTLLADVSELRDEIARTDSRDYRDGLKERRSILNRIVGYLEESRGASGRIG